MAALEAASGESRDEAAGLPFREWRSVTRELAERELDVAPRALLAERLAAALSPRLEVAHELGGHRGCVNRLCWNASGSLLASGSDDLTVVLWDYAGRRLARRIQTGHRANLFGVRFVDDERSLATGAMDCSVRLHALEGGGESRLVGTHAGRVKEIDVDPTNSRVFFSAAEDGVCRQFDTRDPRSLGERAHNVLVNIGAGSGGFKSLALSPAAPHLLAFGCGDQWVRVFDRRMLSPGRHQAVAAAHHRHPRCMMRLAPWHLARVRDVHITYVEWSADGQQLLASYNPEYVHIFDFDGSEARSVALERVAKERADGAGAAASSSSPAAAAASAAASAASRAAKLPPLAEELKQRGNAAFAARRWSDAIADFSAALCVAGPLNRQSAVLLSNRAAALLSRELHGDAAQAVRDCDAAIAIDPSFAKAYIRRVRAYRAAGRLKRSLRLCVDAQRQFPDLEGIEPLLEELRSELAAREQRRAQRRARQEAGDGEGGQENAMRMMLRRILETREAEDEKDEEDDGEEAEDVENGGDEAREDNGAAAANAAREDEAEQEEVGGEAEESSEASSEMARGAQRRRRRREEATENGGEGADDRDVRITTGDEEDEEEEDDDEDIAQGSAAAASASPKRHRGEAAPRPPANLGFRFRRRMGYAQRLVGACNSQTDIKEAVFWGELVLAGSDDGALYAWHRRTGRLLAVVQDVDGSVLNCVQPHPFDVVLAASGIDDTVKLLLPRRAEPRERGDVDALAAENNRRLRRFSAAEQNLISLLLQF
jgi:WD and tetratricopeptide repeat-containing protein 1